MILFVSPLPVGLCGGLKNARIGSIGARTGAFQTVRYSEKLLQASGITVVTCDLSEIIFGAQALSDDDAAVKEHLDALYAYGTISPCIAKESVLKQAKFTHRCQSLDGRE